MITRSIFLIFLLNQVPVSHQWSLQFKLNAANFFDYFYFYTGSDPTHGYVNYVDRDTAFANGYAANDSDGNVYIGCDHHNIASGSGRDSVRLQSNDKYNQGLFMLYLSHMPSGCGTWPAFWTCGGNWPYEGEIDIIEGVDKQRYDKTTLHTGPGCDFSGVSKNFTGSASSKNCDSFVNSNSGCGITNPNSKSYGKPFNAAGGGLYAMEWTDDGIRAWFWNEGSIPSNALSDSPDPHQWGLPYAAFPFGSWCPSSMFKDHQIIFDQTFCGDWDGAVFEGDCPGLGSCTDYVKNHPKKFRESFWLITWLKYFKQ